MNRNFESLVNTLVNIESYIEFHPCMLPEGISKNKIMLHFGFLSPTILILHGSTISGTRFSKKKNSDLDIVCVSSKAAFWPLEQLYERIRENLENESIKIDASIITHGELRSLIEGESSLGVSFSHGFSILYQEGKDELYRPN